MKPKSETIKVTAGLLLATALLITMTVQGDKRGKARRALDTDDSSITAKTEEAPRIVSNSFNTNTNSNFQP